MVLLQLSTTFIFIFSLSVELIGDLESEANLAEF